MVGEREIRQCVTEKAFWGAMMVWDCRQNRGKQRGQSRANIKEEGQLKETLKERKAYERQQMNNEQSALAGTKKMHREMDVDAGRMHGKVEWYFPKAKMKRW